VHYTASKHAVAGLTKALSVELAPKGIRVNAVCPGWVRTEAAIRSARSLAARSGTAELAIIEAVEAGQALPGGLMEPEDVTGPYLFLASDLARNVTGQTLGVDRGDTPW
jgi:NAD(P)-dependent dehydrogenase (short-subunit alcohol dehydrogenase family)